MRRSGRDEEDERLRVRVARAGGAAGELPLDDLRKAVRATLAAEGVEEGEISLTLMDDRRIRELNVRYLDRDRPTDVIAFPLHARDEPVLGDVYVGLDRARLQAREEGIPLAEELVRLAVHGTLHVLGWDHPEGRERNESPMFRRQETLVSRLVGSDGEDVP